MKPMMFVPPAQAEALFDAHAGSSSEEAPPGDRFAPLPWLDEDAPDDLVLFHTAPRTREEKDAALRALLSAGRSAA